MNDREINSPVREIARMLRTSEYSIKGKLQRGRDKLRAALTEREV